MRALLRSTLVASILVGAAGVSAQQKIQLPARDKILTEKPALIYSIGTADGADWEMFSSIRGAAFDARDNLYVLDANNQRVLVFAADGKYVRTISKQGKGPGELMAPTALAVITNGNVVVADPGRRAFSLFEPDGVFLSNVAFADSQGMGAARSPLYAHPRGGVVAQMFVRRSNRPAGTPTGERKAPVEWFDLSSNAKSVQLYQFTLPSITPKVTELAGRGVSITTMPPNWSPPYIFGVLPDGAVAIARSAAYRVEVVGPAGQVLRVIERPIPPRKGTQKDKEVYLESLHDNPAFGAPPNPRTGSGSGITGNAQARITDAMKNAPWMDVIPVLRHLITDPEGRIWISRTPPDFGVEGPVDLLRADGSYIGTIARFSIPAAVSRTGRAAFIERAELGVEHVTVKRLPPAWR